MISMEQLDSIRSHIKQLEKQRDDLNKEIDKQKNMLQGKLQKISESLGFELVRSTKSKSAAAIQKKTKSKKTNTKQRTPAKIKYRDEHGNSWTGRGLTPKWLQKAVDAGKTKEDFLI